MVGEMIRRPNALQKIVHRFLMLRAVTAFFAPRVHRLDQMVLKWTKGRHAISEIVGWPIIQLTTIGAKTNQPRMVPLLGLFDDEKIALVASSLGREHNPGWYYNLKANPECEVGYNGISKTYIARESFGKEREKYFQMGITYYAGYEKYRQRAANRYIPVIVLEPKK